MAAQQIKGRKPQGKKSFQRRRQPDADARAAVRAKKAYHHVKLLQKALKKAKQFEVQKVTRRQKDADLEPAAAQKLALQLEAVKQLDLTDLSHQAGAQYGLVVNPQAGKVQPDAGAAAISLSSALSLMASRLLAAKCVRDVGQAALKELQLLDAAAAAAAAKVAAVAEAAAAAAAGVVATVVVEPADAAAKLGGVGGTAPTVSREQGLGQVATCKGEVASVRVSKRRKLDDRGGVGVGGGLDQHPNGSPERSSEESQGTATGYSSEEPDGFEAGSDGSGSGGSDRVGVDDLDNVSEVSMSDDEGNCDSVQQRKRSLLLLGPSLVSDPTQGPITDSRVKAAGKPSAQTAETGVRGSKKRERGSKDAAEKQASAAIERGVPTQAETETVTKGKAEKKPKNRLGQRARRKLAEEQFGAAAKHVAETPLPPPPPPLIAAHVSGSGMGGDAAESLHPSWAAKRQQKGMLGALSQGTRVVFGEDGAIEKAVPAAAPAAAVAAAEGGAAALGLGPLRRGGQPGKGAARGRGAVAGLGTAERSGNVTNPAVVLPEVSIRDRVRFRAEPAVERVYGGRGRGSSRGAAGGTLHPSWEAKKQLRIRMEHLLKPEGSKLVFKDSD